MLSKLSFAFFQIFPRYISSLVVVVINLLYRAVLLSNLSSCSSVLENCMGMLMLCLLSWISGVLIISLIWLNHFGCLPVCLVKDDALICVQLSICLLFPFVSC